MSNVKTFKKGDVLFKEGDKIQSLQLVQSGSVQVGVVRPKKNLELYMAGPGTVLGEQSLFHPGNQVHTAVATAETKVLEVPIEPLKQQIETMPQVLKLVVRNLVDRTKALLTEVKSYRAERESIPCPDEQVAKVFGTLFHTALRKGKKTDNTCTVEWPVMKNYAQKVFLESPKRLEQALMILVKLKLATVKMAKDDDNPEGPEQISAVNLLDLEAIDLFFEFFQYHYFKNGKTDVLKPEDTYIHLVEYLLKISDGVAPDRNGVVHLEFTKVIERMKQEFRFNLNADHFSRMESKGLFAKRHPTDKGIDLQFELKEFKYTLSHWKIIREIERWNDKGFIDMTEEKASIKSEGFNCPDCKAAFQPEQKFCSQCGHKLAA